MPSGPLSNLPIECFDENWIVTYTPSGSVYSELADREPTETRGVLAVGDPITPSQTTDQRRDQMGPLPFSGVEVRAIAQLSGLGSITLTGQEANEMRISKLAASGELSRFRYVHFATHAVVDEVDALQSALLLSATGSVDSVSRVATGQAYFDEWLTAREIRQNWRLRAELVTLSACRTGVGSGAGLLSFSEALLAAGARRVVVSQWRVDDRATAFLMHRFYENLTTRNQTPSRSLHEARQWLRNLSNLEVSNLTASLLNAPLGPASEALRPFEHPYYWAGFVLIGQ